MCQMSCGLEAHVFLNLTLSTGTCTFVWIMKLFICWITGNHLICLMSFKKKKWHTRLKEPVMWLHCFKMIVWPSLTDSDWFRNPYTPVSQRNIIFIKSVQLAAHLYHEHRVWDSSHGAWTPAGWTHIGFFMHDSINTLGLEYSGIAGDAILLVYSVTVQKENIWQGRSYRILRSINKPINHNTIWKKCSGQC